MNLLSLYVKYVAKAAWSERGLQMKRSLAALALALSASLAATAPGWGQSKPPVAGSQSDIMTALRLMPDAHGTLLDAEGRPQANTATATLQIQEDYIRRLESRLSPAAARAAAKRRETALAGLSEPSDKILNNAVLISELVALAKPEEANDIRLNNYALLARFASASGKPLAAADLAEGKAPGWAHAADILIPELGGVVNHGRVYGYSKECADNGVPVPPPWGSPEWRHVGRLSTTYLVPPHAFPNADSEIWSYVPTSGSMGLCIANPIVNDSSHVTQVDYPHAGQTVSAADALGIICQGLATPTRKSHACFWDNAGPVPLTPTPPIGVANVTYFVAPPSLPDGNRCTDCHAGENAWITHPGQAVDTAKTDFNTTHSPNFTSQDNWYKPLVQSNWPQNPEPLPAQTGNKLCSECHRTSAAGRLPNVAGPVARDRLPKFCSFLLPNVLALHDTPDFSPATMTPYLAGDPQLATDVTTLYNKCMTLFRRIPHFNESAWRQHRDPP